MRLADRRSFLFAREAFARYRLRTALSMGGIVCGVAVALATAAVNEGATQAAMAEVSRLGANTLSIRSRSAGQLTVKDVRTTTMLVPFVERAIPTTSSELRVSGLHGTVVATVVATTSEYARAGTVHVAVGRFLRSDEDDRGPRVCVLGADMARALFEYDDALGGNVRIRGEWYRVVGILGRGGLDRSVVMPFAAFIGRPLSLDPAAPVDELRLQVADARRLDGVAADASRVLALVHAGRSSDYEVRVPRDLIEHRSATKRLFRAAGAATAALLLLLGGLGIMNAMLTAVIERTREIGLRRAVGATRRDIRRQFLVEAGVMAVLGGAGGVAVGIALAAVVARTGNWPVEVSFEEVASVLLLATAIGVASGVYPAIRAARAVPIDAVLHE